METRNLYALVALTLGCVATAVSAWEFLFEGRVLTLLHDPGEELINETLGDHLRYIVTVVIFTAAALVVPTFIAHRAIGRNRKSLLQLQEAHQQLKQANEELEFRVAERTKEFNQAKLVAEQATAAKSAFLATMSHEIRTPLTAIIGFSDSLLNSQQTLSDRVDAIHTINSSGKHLLSIINSILDLSKLEAHKLEITPELVKLWPFLEELSAYARLLAETRGLSFALEPRFPIPEQILADPLRLKQILINLIGNACKFTPAGSLRLVVAYEKPKNQLRLEVIDSGIGMSADQTQRLFQPYSQADAAVTQKFGGTGLGLSISKKLLDLMEGNISVTSTVGKGSCFSIGVPCGIEQPPTGMLLAKPETGMPDRTPDAQDETTFRGSVLLVEDTPSIQKLVALFLRRFGLNVAVANDGQEAVDILSQKPADLVLMDMQMPVMDGLEATSILRSRGYGGVIIALTADITEDKIDACLAAGCNGHLGKPITREVLARVLEEYLPKAPGSSHADNHTRTETTS